MDNLKAQALIQIHRTEIALTGVARSPICYIAGPMTGYENFNFPAFEEAASSLRAVGWFVYAPHENDLERGEAPRLDGVPQYSLKHYMEVDLAQVCRSDAIFLLPGWEKSRGATLEYQTAKALDIDCYEYESGQFLFPQADPGDENDSVLIPLDGKATNPKDLVGSGKLPLHLWPTTATSLGCLGLLDGMLKYGRTNWRAAGVRYSVYHDAVIRHLNAKWEGEDCDPDSGLPHLAHALACLAIIVDADAHDKLIDDRSYIDKDSPGYREYVETLTPWVEMLKKLHTGKSPKHYTIQERP